MHTPKILRYKGKRRTLAMFFFGTILFSLGLVIFPEFKVEIWSNNMQSPFVLLGLSFFLAGGYLGIKDKS